MKIWSVNEKEKGVKRKEYDEGLRMFLLESGSTVCESWEFDWWKEVKKNVDVAGDYMKTTYPYQQQFQKTSWLKTWRVAWSSAQWTAQLKYMNVWEKKIVSFPLCSRNIKSV